MPACSHDAVLCRLAEVDPAFAAGRFVVAAPALSPIMLLR
jgi:hypothetical protein